jgi:hypothetical protein
MLRESRLLAWAIVMGLAVFANGQDVKGFVEQAVRTELAADAADHTHWLYYEVDQKPEMTVKQWVAEARPGDLQCVLEKNGRPMPRDEASRAMESFAHDVSAQARQRRNSQHDDKQAEDMLNLLPHAFLWAKTGVKDGETILAFKPDPQFRPPSYQARVFAAMEGTLRVNNTQHRIVSLQGKLIHDVRFGGGLLGDLRAGGSFAVERREISPGIWQITESHIHIQGRALLFKNISEEEDDVKTKFRELPADISFASAEKELLAQSGQGM